MMVILGELMYFEYVKLIMDVFCVGCYIEGVICVQMFLDTFESVVSFGVLIKNNVVECVMLLWYVGEGCNDYVGDFFFLEE